MVEIIGAWGIMSFAGALFGLASFVLISFTRF